MFPFKESDSVFVKSALNWAKTGLHRKMDRPEIRIKQSGKPISRVPPTFYLLRLIKVPTLRNILSDIKRDLTENNKIVKKPPKKSQITSQSKQAILLSHQNRLPKPNNN
jgi:hypothetical protein